MLQGFLPMDVGIAVHEVVVVVVPVRFCEVVTKLAVRQGCRLLSGIDTCLVDGHGVEGGKHPDVGEDGGVIVTVAVAVR